MSSSSTSLATGTLGTTSWTEEVFADLEGAPKLSQDAVIHSFAGKIEGEGTWRNLNAYSGEASAIYAGFERIVGKLGGRSGSFVLQTAGTFESGVAVTTWTVVAGTGTGELRGLRGQGGDTARAGDDRYSYNLEYDFQ